jgi:hypothetical protein
MGWGWREFPSPLWGRAFRERRKGEVGIYLELSSSAFNPTR